MIDLNGPNANTVPSGFDSGFYLPSSAWLNAADSQAALQDWDQSMEYAGNLPDHLHIATVLPHYEPFDKGSDDGKAPTAAEFKSTYDQTWGIALKGDFDMTLIFAWNEYFGGACIQPTREIGTQLLQRTAVWASMFKRGCIRVD